MVTWYRIHRHSTDISEVLVVRENPSGLHLALTVAERDRLVAIARDKLARAIAAYGAAPPRAVARAEYDARITALEARLNALERELRKRDHGGTEAADLSGSGREHTPPDGAASVQPSPAPRCPDCGDPMLDDRDGMTGADWFCANGHRAVLYVHESPAPWGPSEAAAVREFAAWWHSVHDARNDEDVRDGADQFLAQEKQAS